MFVKRKLQDNEVVVCRSLNQVVVADNTGKKWIITDPQLMAKSDKEIKLQFKNFNVVHEGVK